MKNFLILCVLTIISVNTYATPQSNIFTYQGELIQNSLPANGNYEMAVSVYTDAMNGTHLLGVNFLSVPVVNGLFTLNIDFGSTVFVGDERWIELSVRDFTTPNLTVLSPRQLIANAPYAIHSQFVGNSGVNSDAIQAGSVTNIKITDGAITQAKLQNNSVGSLQVINASITEAKLADNSVTTPKLANDSVTTTKIADDAITSDELANNSVNTDSILNGTIVAADINNNSVQQRISGTCSPGSSIASILANGTVTCENDDVGITGWGLTGNSGTNPSSQFIGTTDLNDFVVKVNNIESMRISPHSGITLGDFNNIASGAYNSIISGGTNNSIESVSMLQNTNLSSITGGTLNKIKDTSSRSSIIGGYGNVLKGDNSVISGGQYNEILGDFSAVIGGRNNLSNSNYSFTSGFGSKASHNGSWVWNDYSSVLVPESFESTGVNQFLIRAQGGVGIGTKSPSSQLHVKGVGTSYGTLLDEVVLTVEPQVFYEDVSLVINKLDSSNESALAFTTNKVPEFDIRTVNGGALDFNSYQAGTAKFMMRINDSGTNRIDFNTNLEPQTDNVFDIGSSSFRFAAMHATNINSTNPVNVTSDRRLKSNIIALEYGLSEILNLKPVNYRLINGGNDKKHLGLIAQEVEKLIPEIVNKSDDKNQTRSMRYTELVPVLIKATQEQQVLIDQQSEQIKELIKTNKLLLKHINIK